MIVYFSKINIKKISFRIIIKILQFGMIWTHNVYKGYQQTTLADRELKVGYHLNMLYKAFIYLEIL